MQKIYADSIEEMVNICDRLTKRNLSYTARLVSGEWEIEITGY